MSIPVTLFNANTLGVSIVVNSASTPITMGGTNANLLWQPQRNGQVTMVTDSAPAPNVIGLGCNSLSVTPTGGLQPMDLVIDPLAEGVVWRSLELYILFNTMSTVSLVFLNDGQFVTRHELHRSPSGGHRCKHGGERHGAAGPMSA